VATKIPRLRIGLGRRNRDGARPTRLFSAIGSSARFWAVLWLGVAIGGIVIAALGQAQTTRELAGRLSWLAPFADDIEDVYVEPKRVIAGMVLLAIGATLFALAASRGKFAASGDEAVLEPPAGLPALPARDIVVSLVSLAAASYFFATLLSRLYDGDYEHALVLRLGVALALAAVPFALLDRRSLAWTRPRWSWSVVVALGLLAACLAMFVVLAHHDLNHWRYSALGDEYAFYGVAAEIANGAPFHIFSQLGVYEQHPVFSSAYAAFFIESFGGDNFAWKLASVVVVAGTLATFYLLLWELFSWRVAACGTALLSVSHYLLGLSHTGYNSLDALFPTTLSLYLLVVGLRRGSTVALFASGAAAGLGFYVFLASRATIIIVGLYLLTFGLRGLRPKTLLPIAIGFAMVAAPIFTLHGWDVIEATTSQSAAGYEAGVTGDRILRFVHNIVPNLMAFNYNFGTKAYVTGSLLDSVTAVLFALGLALAVGRLRRPVYRLLLVWWLVTLAVSGFANPRAEVAMTRLFFVLPPAAALAGLALHECLAPVQRLTRNRALQSAVVVVGLVALLIPVLMLNLRRAWEEAPAMRIEAEALAIGAVVSEECATQPPAAVVTVAPEGLPLLAFGARQMAERAPLLVSYEDALSSSNIVGSGDWQGCVVLIPDGDQAVYTQIQQRFARVYEDRSYSEMSDQLATRRVFVWE
jgi:hypothetical protein